MKSLFEDQPPPHTSNHASTSGCGQSKDDQEMGSNAMSKSGSVLKNSAFSCFLQGVDLNLGRMVREMRSFHSLECLMSFRIISTRFS